MSEGDGERAATLTKGVLDALNAFLQDNDGRAPRLIEMGPGDWSFLRDFLKEHREAGFSVTGGIAPAKLEGRENFVLYGLPIVAAEGCEAPRAVATEKAQP